VAYFFHAGKNVWLDEPGSHEFAQPWFDSFCSPTCRATAHREEKAKARLDLMCGHCGSRLHTGLVMYVPGLALSKPFTYLCFPCCLDEALWAKFGASLQVDQVCFVCKRPKKRWGAKWWQIWK
jgi:hypothetical protein